MSFKKLIKTSSVKLSTFLLTLLILLISPVIILLLFVPVYTYHYIILRLSKLLRPDLIRILDPQSSTYVATKSETNVILCLKISGNPNEEELANWKNVFLNKVILAKSESGELIYPEFQQFVTTWLGYPFWKNDEDFSIANHILMRDYASDCDLSTIESELLRSEFEERQSPWALVICRNLERVQTDFTIFYKFHHTLSDGYAIFNVLMRWADSPVVATKNTAIPKLDQIAYYISFPFKASYDLAKVIIGQINTETLWPDFKPEDKSEMRTYLKSKLISTKDLRRMSTECKISFTAALIGGISNGVLDFLTKTGKPIPNKIICPMPMPKPRGNLDSLQNNFTVGLLYLPISGEVESSLEKFQLCNAFLAESKNSYYQKIVSIILEFLGRLPTALLRFQTNQMMMEPLFFSNFAGPRHQISLGGFEVLDMSFSINFSKCYPMIITLLTYNGNLRFGLSLDNNLFPENFEVVAAELLHSIENGLCSLENNNN